MDEVLFWVIGFMTIPFLIGCNEILRVLNIDLPKYFRRSKKIVSASLTESHG